MVDGAHGAHLPFLGYEGYRAADVVVMSAHKTLPAPGQSALLFANGFPLSELQRWGSVYPGFLQALLQPRQLLGAVGAGADAHHMAQSALLFANGFPLSELQRWGSVYGSSSPSYVFMAALDAAPWAWHTAAMAGISDNTP